jgi:hypothetical protein
MQEHTSPDATILPGADYRPPTYGSIEAAKEAQERERAAFTRSTGIPLTADGCLKHRAVLQFSRD